MVRYLADQIPWPYPPDGARHFVENLALPAMARGQQWHWSIREQAAPEALIGVISLMDDEPDNHRGFWLAPAWQGRGYMSEACEAVTGYWFETLGKPLLRAPKAAPNAASRRISEKSGMRLLRRGTRLCQRPPSERAVGNQPRGGWRAATADARGWPCERTAGAGGSGDCAPSHASLIYSRSPCSPPPAPSRRLPPFSPRFPAD